MKKILFSFGTRPEAIKMAPLIYKLKEIGKKKLTVRVCVTAQHRGMLDDVLSIFQIKPDFDLNIMRKNQSLTDIAERVMKNFSSVLKREKPDLVLVHGDTSTTLLSSLAAYYQKIPIGHVEAGLRSFDDDNPFPEEMNRRLTDSLSTFHYCPTDQSLRNLLQEGISRKGIFITGNTIVDALHWVASQPHEFRDPSLRRLFHRKSSPINKHRLILVTAHRRENFGEPLKNIFRSLKKIVQTFPDVYIIYPVHLNPNVKNAAFSMLRHPQIHLTKPLNYLDFAHLIKKSYLVVTDSGGLQEEAPSLGKPVLVLRRVTERPEAIKAGTVKLIGHNQQRVYREISKILRHTREWRKMARAVNPYGDGLASKRTAEAILYSFGYRSTPPKNFKSRTQRR